MRMRTDHIEDVIEAQESVDPDSGRGCEAKAKLVQHTSMRDQCEAEPEEGDLRR